DADGGASDGGASDGADDGENNEEASDECEHTGGTATCTEGKKCDTCGKVYTEPAPHDFSGDGECECGAKCDHATREGHSCKACALWIGHTSETACTVEGCNFTKNGDTITLGMYPQTEEKDATLIAALNGKVGSWTNYNYNGCEIYYADVENDGVKYRGVKKISDRPTGEGSTPVTNGYSASESTIYWFKYEAITWKVIDDTQADKVLVLADLAIDAQNFGTDKYYSLSTIRVWLIENFYNTAFSKIQQEVILATSIDLDENGSGDAEDKVFLITKAEADKLNGTTGDNWSITKKATDYAKIQGVYVNSDGNAQWIQRTEGPTVSAVSRVTSVGELRTAAYYVTTVGIVPAMWISLK
ncbi:MAG: hypothetical protein J6U68_00640, partial [Clostridia bacterium]|nr:hypothetical protein [Clostridia bacterium]